MIRRIGRLVGAAAATLALAAGGIGAATTPAVAAPLPIEQCTTTSGVVLAVDFSKWGGPLLRSCGTTPTTGYTLLNQGGWKTTGTGHDGPAFICRIGYSGFQGGKQFPTPDQEKCVLTPPATAYWSYWHADPGQNDWSYSQLGAMSYQPKPGSVDLWIFGGTNIEGTEGRPTVAPDTLRAHNTSTGGGTGTPPDPTPPPTDPGTGGNGGSTSGGTAGGAASSGGSASSGGAAATGGSGSAGGTASSGGSTGSGGSSAGAGASGGGSAAGTGTSGGGASSGGTSGGATTPKKPSTGATTPNGTSGGAGRPRPVTPEAGAPAPVPTEPAPESTVPPPPDGASTEPPAPAPAETPETVESAPAVAPTDTPTAPAPAAAAGPVVMNAAPAADAPHDSGSIVPAVVGVVLLVLLGLTTLAVGRRRRRQAE
ncbi:hypothetical protein SAMN05216371_0584 [Streptomyces sp. TLI_053]|nr:hypothetical protein SAMN05216371_0584 [Streptomyces sp. TLI_053]